MADGGIRSGVLIAVTLLLGCPLEVPFPAGPLLFGPYLQNVTKTSIVVSWRTREDSIGFVEYGPADAYGQTASDGVSARQHQVTLTGLAPGTEYHWRLAVPSTRGRSLAVLLLVRELLGGASTRPALPASPVPSEVEGLSASTPGFSYSRERSRAARMAARTLFGSGVFNRRQASQSAIASA